jgi:hypothetical protein
MANETLERAEEFLAFHEGSATSETPGSQPTVRINGEDFAAALAGVREGLAAQRLLCDALGALQDPENHIWHGSNGECTGECRDVQAALARARGEVTP